MAKTLQFRRGNAATAAAFTGNVGELFVNTDTNVLSVHDGSTAGGTPVAKASDVTSKLAATSGTACNLTLAGTLTASASAGTAGKALTSTGTGVCWGAVPTAAETGTAANLTLTGTLTASSSAGTAGKPLTSTGTGVCWGAVPIAAETGTAANLTLTGTLTANSGVGTSGQVLTSTGTGVCWATASGGSVSLSTGNNFFVGGGGAVRTSGLKNIGIGYQALLCVTSGSSNIGFGYCALKKLTTGCYNVGLGRTALINTTTGQHNFAVGCSALYCNQAGKNNVAIGPGALQCKTTPGCYNIAIGQSAGVRNTGCRNVFMGRQSGYGYYTTTSGTDNVMIGYRTGFNLSTGGTNVAIGACAGKGIAAGYTNVAIGPGSLAKHDGYINVGIGDAAGAQTAGRNNVFIGRLAGYGLGAPGGGSTGCNEVWIGHRAGYKAVSGDNNVGLGNCTLFNKTTGTNNTAIGGQAGYSTTTGSNNVFLGYLACGIAAGCSDTITLGNSSITTIRAQVTSITALSDCRDKKEVASVPYGLKLINKVRPVTFTWEMRDGSKVGQKEAGFIAQELKAVKENSPNVSDWISDIVISNEDETRYEAAPNKLLPFLIKAVQELSDKNDQLELRITALENK